MLLEYLNLIMIRLDKIFGRLGNRMFQLATLYAYAREKKVDFYFQDEKWWKGYEKEIKQLFGSDIEPIDMVSIHVRRGDYVNNPFYVDLIDDGYYERAIELFPDEDFLVFSDDIEFCKRYFIGRQFTFCEEKDEIKSLNLMAGCRANIIANSSFSWWAAYLNPNQNKKVVAPLAWFADGVERTKLPDNWIKI